MSLKFEKRQQIGAKGSMDGIFWGGLAVCAGRAEALEFGKILHLISHACAPQRGRRKMIPFSAAPRRRRPEGEGGSWTYAWICGAVERLDPSRSMSEQH